MSVESDNNNNNNNNNKPNEFPVRPQPIPTLDAETTQKHEIAIPQSDDLIRSAVEHLSGKEVKTPGEAADPSTDARKEIYLSPMKQPRQQHYPLLEDCSPMRRLWADEPSTAKDDDDDDDDDDQEPKPLGDGAASVPPPYIQVELIASLSTLGTDDAEKYVVGHTPTRRRSSIGSAVGGSIDVSMDSSIESEIKQRCSTPRSA